MSEREADKDSRSVPTPQAVIDEIKALVVGLSEQQAMPDGWWQPRLDALLAVLSPLAQVDPDDELVAGEIERFVNFTNPQASPCLGMTTPQWQRIINALRRTSPSHTAANIVQVLPLAPQPETVTTSTASPSSTATFDLWGLKVENIVNRFQPMQEIPASDAVAQYNDMLGLSRRMAALLDSTARSARRQAVLPPDDHTGDPEPLG